MRPRREGSTGRNPAAGTFVRLFAGSATVVSTGADPSSNSSVTLACPAYAEVFAIVM